MAGLFARGRAQWSKFASATTTPVKNQNLGRSFVEVEVKGKVTQTMSPPLFLWKKRSFPVPNSRFYDEVGLFFTSSEAWLKDSSLKLKVLKDLNQFFINSYSSFTISVKYMR